jgi:hypothetical protein
MAMNIEQEKRVAIWLGVFIAALILVDGKADSAETETAVNKAQLQLDISWPQCPVELKLSPLPAETNSRDYQALSERLSLRDDEMITIMVLSMINHSSVDVSASLEDIVALTKATRHLFRAYLHEGPVTGSQIYRLPIWDTVVTIPAGGKRADLRLAFIVKKGAHADFERSLKIYICFSHEELEGIYHSIAVSAYDPQGARNADQVEPGSEYVIPPVSAFVSDDLTSEAARSLRFPNTPMSPGGPSIFLEYLLGEKPGKDSKLPYWIGIARAIDQGHFDYYTAMVFLHHIKVYRDKYPSKLARNSIWIPEQGIILASTEHRVYIASSGRGVLTVPHGAAEVLLYVASEALSIGINPTDTAPIPGTYSSTESEHVFELDCRGVSIKATSTETGYDIEIKKPDETTISLAYTRKAAEYE